MSEFFIHDFNPIAINLGGFPIRWYGLAYLGGFLFAFAMMRQWARQGLSPLAETEIEDVMTVIILGVLVGGRLGYVFFYHPLYYMAYPWEIFALWKGGMSFHGGLLGVIGALIIHGRRMNRSVWQYLDNAAATVPFGICLGRLANFVNGELYGRISHVSWAVIFPDSQYPRHPSQIYEALLEGIIPLIILMVVVRYYDGLKKWRGGVSALFLMLYALARMTSEFFREPDAHIGFLWGMITMGQLLSLPMLLLGVWLFYHRVLVQK